MTQATKQNICKEWPQAVRDLAGAWADFPLAEDIRRGSLAPHVGARDAADMEWEEVRRLAWEKAAEQRRTD